MSASSEPIKKNNISYLSSLPGVPANKSISGPIEDDDSQVAADLPPFEVLLQWLGYYHEQSGAWPTPPDRMELPDRPEVPRAKPKSKPQPAPIPVKEAPRERGVKPYPAAPGSDLTPIQTPGSFNSYDYQASVYYTAAIKVIRSSQVSTNISAGAVLVLSSILAWTQHPFFKDKCLTAQGWMSLPLNRWSRELKMRKASLSLYLEELQKAGLIIYGTLNEPILEKRETQLLFEEREKFALLTAANNDSIGSTKVYKQRFTPAYIRIYRLSVTLTHALPAFDPESTPFASAAGIRQASDTKTAALQFTGTDLQELNQDRYNPGNPLKNLEDTVPGNVEPYPSETNNKMAPCTCSNNLKHEFKSYKNHAVKHAQYATQKESGPVETKQGTQNLSLTPLTSAGIRGPALNLPGEPVDFSQDNVSEEVFVFLTTAALFPGFSRSDGRQTLDEREALKFASSPVLTLSRVKQIYFQVLSLWTVGKCNKNPIGFLHNRLNKCLAEGGSATGTGSPKITLLPVSDSSPEPCLNPADTLTNLKPSRRQGGILSEFENISDVTPTVEPVFDEQAVTEFSESDNGDFILLKQVLDTLKKNVVESLSARYRRPDFSRIVDIRDWKTGQTGETIQLILAEPVTGSYPYFFSEGDKSLLKLVISQDLTSAVARKINFQLVV